MAPRFCFTPQPRAVSVISFRGMRAFTILKEADFMKQNNGGKNPVKKVQRIIPSDRDRTVLVLLGFGYIFTSLTQMTALGDYKHYQYLFEQYSSASISLRFFISWMVRIAGLIFGVGLLCKKEIFRKLALGLAAGTMAVAYWKHPYEAFTRHIQYLDEHMSSNFVGAVFSPKMGAELMSIFSPDNFSEPDFVHLCVYTIVAWEIFCAAVVIFVLTRPKIKALFR